MPDLRRFQSLVALFMGLVLLGCGSAAAASMRIVALGDSLTAGYRLAPGEGFPARLQAALVARGHDVEVVDAGVSGDTASGGADRVDWSIGPDAGAVIVELGANDALRGVSPGETRTALDRILTRLAARGLPVLLAGMLAPPNLGPDFGNRFNAIFPDLARAHDVVLYPFFLDGVIGRPELLLDDGMHPNAAGVEEIVRRILPRVEALIERAGSVR